MGNSSLESTSCNAKPPALEKPAKPYAEFPLYSHNTKRWAKKIKGRTHFFGKWDNWQGALDQYLYEMPFLLQGRTPPPRDLSALTVGDMVNSMLEHSESKVDSGEMAKRTFDDYKKTGAWLIAELGRYTTVESLNSQDFTRLRKKLSDGVGLVTLRNQITRASTFFNYAYKSGQLPKPVVMGMAFAKPNSKSMKREKQSKAEKLFTIDELRTLYHAAGKPMRAFILLALNGGLGNSDIGQLEFRHIQDGWIKYPRPKTAVDRQFPLWSETIAAINAAKQTKHADSPYVFITRYGQIWHKEVSDSPITKEFAKLLKDAELHQVGRGFYSLRHTFRTVADGCRDQVAINHIMGHSDNSMSANYTHGIEPERLQAVVDHVHAWVKPMFKKPAKKKAGAK